MFGARELRKSSYVVSPNRGVSHSAWSRLGSSAPQFLRRIRGGLSFQHTGLSLSPVKQTDRQAPKGKGGDRRDEGDSSGGLGLMAHTHTASSGYLK